MSDGAELPSEVFSGFQGQVDVAMIYPHFVAELGLRFFAGL